MGRKRWKGTVWKWRPERERERRLHSLGFKCERALDPIFKFHDPNRRKTRKNKMCKFSKRRERKRESKKKKRNNTSDDREKE